MCEWGSQLFLEGVKENIMKPLCLQFPSVEYRSRGVPLCGHVTDWLFYSFFFFNCLAWLYCLWSITCTASTLKSPKSFSKFNHKGVTEKMSMGQVERPEWVEATLTAMMESQIPRDLNLNNPSECPLFLREQIHRRASICNPGTPWRPKWQM